MNNVAKQIDILCVGEVLIDFIGHQTGVLINKTKDYHRYLGGSPTNVAINSARLGLNSVLVASVGYDGFAEYIFKRLAEVDVNTRFIKKIKNEPTSVIFVSRSEGTPDFIPYRKADFCITEDQIPENILKTTNIFHTTCFALSKEPAQSTIMKKAESAFQLGCKLSIDINYSEKLWDSRDNAIAIIKSYCKFNPLIKVSEDDMLRLFSEKLSHDDIFNFFHNKGVDTVCLTLGSRGVKLSEKNKDVIQLPAKKIEKIADSTGAGDAFWSGFLSAYIKKKSTLDCLEVALKLAALKIQNVGRLPDNIDNLTNLV